jgi:hypothetical protein
MKSTSPELNWIIFLTLTISALATFLLGDRQEIQITGMVLGAIALLFPIGFVLQLKPGKVPEKYQKWLHKNL